MKSKRRTKRRRRRKKRRNLGTWEMSGNTEKKQEVQDGKTVLLNS